MLHLMMAFVLSLVLSLAVTPLVIRILLVSRIIDIPNRRSSHVKPVARGGGFGIMVPLFLVVTFMHIAGMISLDAHAVTILSGIAGMILIGFLDDIFSLSALTRLALEGMLMAGWIAVANSPLSEIALPFLPTIGTGAAGWILAWLYLVGFPNLFNFMDGINGLAGSQTLIACVALAVLGHLSGNETVALFSTIIAGGALGFLRYNFRVARVFMGDSGSLPIGYFLAAATLQLAAPGSGIPIVVPVLVIWVFLFDAGLTLVFRLLRGRKLHHAHKEHLYQRLVTMGSSHTRVTGIYSLLMLCAAAAAILYQHASDPVRLFLLITVMVASSRFARHVVISFRRYGLVNPTRHQQND